MTPDNQCLCECNDFTMVPVRGFGLALDTGGLGIKPGPDDTHLVTRNGKLVWEPVTDGNCLCMPPENLYVATDGDDANDGLTPEAPFATLQAAVDSTAKYAAVGRAITINVASGTYEGGVYVDMTTVYPFLAIRGDQADYPEVNGIVASGNGRMDINYIHSKGERPFQCTNFSDMRVTDCKATGVNSPVGIFFVGEVSAMRFFGTIEAVMNDSSKVFFSAVQSGFMRVDYADFILNGTCKTTMHAESGSVVQALRTDRTMSGTVTGSRYDVRANACIRSGNRPNLFPGSSAGTTSNGGVYY